MARMSCGRIVHRGQVFFRRALLGIGLCTHVIHGIGEAVPQLAI